MSTARLMKRTALTILVVWLHLIGAAAVVEWSFGRQSASAFVFSTMLTGVSLCICSAVSLLGLIWGADQ